MEVTFGKLRLRPQWWQLILLGLASLGLMLLGNWVMQVIGVALGVANITVLTRLLAVDTLVLARMNHERVARAVVQSAYHLSTACVAGIVCAFVGLDGMWGRFWLCAGVLNGLFAITNIVEYAYVFLFAPHELSRLDERDGEGN